VLDRLFVEAGSDLILNNDSEGKQRPHCKFNHSKSQHCKNNHCKSGGGGGGHCKW
jgi:hypothetical protein